MYEWNYILEEIGVLNVFYTGKYTRVLLLAKPEYLRPKKRNCPTEGRCMLQVQIIIFGTFYQYKSAAKEAELTFPDLRLPSLFLCILPLLPAQSVYDCIAKQIYSIFLLAGFFHLTIPAAMPVFSTQCHTNTSLKS